MAAMKAQYFESAADFRKWLAKNHDKESELLVGFYNKSSGKQGMTYEQSVEEALCYGWIDGVRKGVDAERHTMRFTPRRPKSKWSLVNVRRVEKLIEQKKMTKAGLDAYAARVNQKAIDYSYEVREKGVLSPAYKKQFEAKKRAWKYFNEQPPWYRRTCMFWVMTAKKEETQLRRLKTLIESSAKGEWIPGYK
jgi:uncharacterized protein YdeI (YjbR/CyaY-like superfamily)